jgi:hypothetical protein
MPMFDTLQEALNKSQEQQHLLFNTAVADGHCSITRLMELSLGRSTSHGTEHA